MIEFPDILNWRRFDTHITSSGQPTEKQLELLRDAGVLHIINLGPHDNKGALEDEPGTVAALGMSYVYIPVDFRSPTDADFDQFCAVLDHLKGQPTHVHCIYNARVSAFLYRLARSGQAGSVADAKALMDSIWKPGDHWAAFIGSDEAVGQPDRYAGYDY
ncbi:MAG: protein tyrosine phosphatase family protein [Pseudomonadota bacterium]